MTDLVGSGIWAVFNSLMNEDATDTFMKDTVIWRRVTADVDRWMEDSSAEVVTEISLNCLFNFNYRDSYIRTQEKASEEGDLEKDACAMIFNIAYLNNLGYINDKGAFNYDPGKDRFVYKGSLYKARGDNPLADAQTNPLFYLLIVERMSTPSGESRIENS